MTLIKTSILTSISTIIKIITSFFITKIISIYIGPSGLAIIGQLQNFNSIITTLANGAINTGVIKYVSEYKDNMEQKSKYLSTAIIITIISSIIVGISLNAFSTYLSTLILKSNEYSNVFILFGFTVVFFSLNTLLMSILNAQGEIPKYILINILSNLLSLVFTSFLIFKLGLIGALYAMVTNQSIIFFVTLFFVTKSSWFKLIFFKKGIDKNSALKLGKYSIMALTSILMVHTSHLIIRNYIGNHLSWDEAGYWQAIWYISSVYLMVITVALNVYYIPKLSSIKNKNELKQEILNGYKLILPIIFVIICTIYIFKGLIISIAFTDSFLPMLELFKWQLIGDFIKISSYLMSYIMLAKAMTKMFIYTEFLSSLLFVVLSVLFINNFGLVGITYAYSLNYLIYLCIMIIIFRRIL